MDETVVVYLMADILSKIETNISREFSQVGHIYMHTYSIHTYKYYYSIYIYIYIYIQPMTYNLHNCLLSYSLLSYSLLSYSLLSYSLLSYIYIYNNKLYTTISSYVSFKTLATEFQNGCTYTYTHPHTHKHTSPFRTLS